MNRLTPPIAAALIAVALIALGLAPAHAIDAKPGLYEMTSTTETAGQPPHTGAPRSNCVKPGNTDPIRTIQQEMAQRNPGQCAIANLKQSATAASFDISCSAAIGVKSAHVDMTATADGFIAHDHAVFAATPGGAAHETTVSVVAVRKGDCPAPPATAPAQP